MGNPVEASNAWDGFAEGLEPYKPPAAEDNYIFVSRRSRIIIPIIYTLTFISFALAAFGVWANIIASLVAAIFFVGVATFLAFLEWI